MFHKKQILEKEKHPDENKFLKRRLQYMKLVNIAIAFLRQNANVDERST